MKYLKINLILLLLVAPFISNAQFKFGAAAGLNSANFSNKDISSIQNVLGYNLGFMFEVKLPIKIGVELDVLYSTKGSSLIVDEVISSFTSDYSLQYIDLPVVAKIYTFKVVSFQIGAQYSHLIGAELNIEGIAKKDVKDQFNPGDLSAVVGIGVDVSKIHFSARYNLGLITINNGGDNNKSNMFTFSVGYWLK
jgi:hypothetical protein